MNVALSMFDAAMALVWLACVVAVGRPLLSETAARWRQLCRRGPNQPAAPSNAQPPKPAAEAGGSQATDEVAESIEIKIAINPATCERQARRLGLLEMSARSIAACLGLELTDQQRPPSVCYEFAALIVVGVISQEDGQALLGAAMAIEQTTYPHRCPLCWLHEQVAQYVAAARRRAVYDYAAAPYGRPNV